MMGSSDARGAERNRFEENISVKDCRAACICPTDTRPSACLRIASGLEYGAMMFSFFYQNLSISEEHMVVVAYL